ncbi:MAG: T9SS type A sorting domain-containing protein, partial [Bacteroidota bacterium]
GVLLINSNPALTSLTGLNNVTYIGIEITNNPLLSDCAVQSICEYLANGKGTTHIYGNATGCNSIEEVKDACGITSVENLASESSLTIYPNPASTIIITETPATYTQSLLSIMNVSGQVMIARQITEPNTQVDISNLSSGVYFVRLTGEMNVAMGKFIKK